jgi:hypothetical protein
MSAGSESICAYFGWPYTIHAASTLETEDMNDESDEAPHWDSSAMHGHARLELAGI